MLRTFQILMPATALASLTTLGLCVIRYGGSMNIQLGPETHIQIEAPGNGRDAKNTQIDF